MLAQIEKIQKIEVGLAGWPEIFGPGFNVVAGLVLDEVGHVPGHHVLHQDDLRMVF